MPKRKIVFWRSPRNSVSTHRAAASTRSCGQLTACLVVRASDWPFPILLSRARRCAARTARLAEATSQLTGGSLSHAPLPNTRLHERSCWACLGRLIQMRRAEALSFCSMVMVQRGIGRARDLKSTPLASQEAEAYWYQPLGAVESIKSKSCPRNQRLFGICLIIQRFTVGEDIVRKSQLAKSIC